MNKIILRRPTILLGTAVILVAIALFFGPFLHTHAQIIPPAGTTNISNSQTNSAPFAPVEYQQVCPSDAKACPDGSYVSRTGPNCTFTPCPGEENNDGNNIVCPTLAKQCPDGSFVSPVGPDCEFPQCADISEGVTPQPPVMSHCGNLSETVCLRTQGCEPYYVESMQPCDSNGDCPNLRSYSGCEVSARQICPDITKACPDGSYVTPTGPNCTLPACPGEGSRCLDLDEQTCAATNGCHPLYVLPNCIPGEECVQKVEFQGCAQLPLSNNTILSNSILSLTVADFAKRAIQRETLLENTQEQQDNIIKSVQALADQNDNPILADNTQQALLQRVQHITEVLHMTATRLHSTATHIQGYLTSPNGDNYETQTAVDTLTTVIEQVKTTKGKINQLSNTGHVVLSAANPAEQLTLFRNSVRLLREELQIERDTLRDAIVVLRSTSPQDTATQMNTVTNQ